MDVKQCDHCERVFRPDDRHLEMVVVGQVTLGEPQEVHLCDLKCLNEFAHRAVEAGRQW